MRIKYLREQEKLSQQQLAEKVGLTRGQVERFENQISHKECIESLIKLADYFDVSLDYLCERKFINGIGYVQDNRREDINHMINLSDKKFKMVTNFVKAIDEENT